MTRRLFAIVLVTAWAAADARPAAAQAALPAAVEADFVARDVAFASGERLRRCGCTIAPSAPRARTPTV